MIEAAKLHKISREQVIGRKPTLKPEIIRKPEISQVPKIAQITQEPVINRNWPSFLKIIRRL